MKYSFMSYYHLWNYFRFFFSISIPHVSFKPFCLIIFHVISWNFGMERLPLKMWILPCTFMRMDLRGRHSFLSCDVNAHDDVTLLLTPFVHPVVLFTPTQGRMKYQIFNSSDKGNIFLANFFPFSFPFSFFSSNNGQTWLWKWNRRR